MSIKIKPVPKITLSDQVTSNLAASIIRGDFPANTQLPSERDLVTQLDISRSTLREALKVLADNHLIEARQGVGWFVCRIDDSNVAKAHALAGGGHGGERRASSSSPTVPVVRLTDGSREHTKPRVTLGESQPAPAEAGIPASTETPSGPRRLPVAKEKPLKIPNLKKDRLGTFDFISWWERDKVEAAKVLVVGAGALGNEVVKNLALMGVGHLFVIDFDTIEAANLSRSILFRETDDNRQKAKVVAARAKEINPGVHIQYLHGDVTTSLGLGVFRRMDVIIGCLDNREARLAINRFSYWMNKPWVDGAIQELLGLVRTFVPGEGACYECTLTEQARRDLALRYSCPLLARQNVLLGKVPTTPTIASIIGAMQSQEALKLIHDMDVEAGKVTHFNGLVNHMHTTAYMPREDCESHWVYGDVTELPLRAENATLNDLLTIARNDLGLDAVIELDQEVVLELECLGCSTKEAVLKPMSQVSFESAHCPNCGAMREVNLTHLITGEEEFLHHTLASIGVPPLHILRVNNGEEYRFYELTGDLEEALHFSHFEGKPVEDSRPIRERIRIKEEVQVETERQNPASGKIKLKD
ncbi:MAG: ThiF family adenylyltransferase [Anaerolineales bacterium]